MKIWLDLFGYGDTLNILQMSFRAFIVFFITLILIRIAGRRSFGFKTPFDNVLVILLGAILSRPVVGASPFLPTLFACLVISVLHRIFAIIAIFSPQFEKFTKGSKIPLYKNGKFIQKNLIRSLTSKEDLLTGLRSVVGTTSLENVDSIYMEGNGKLSVLLKDQRGT